MIDQDIEEVRNCVPFWLKVRTILNSWNLYVNSCIKYINTEKGRDLPINIFFLLTRILEEPTTG